MHNGGAAGQLGCERWANSDMCGGFRGLIQRYRWSEEGAGVVEAVEGGGLVRMPARALSPQEKLLL